MGSGSGKCFKWSSRVASRRAGLGRVGSAELFYSRRSFAVTCGMFARMFLKTRVEKDTSLMAFARFSRLPHFFCVGIMLRFKIWQDWRSLIFVTSKAFQQFVTQWAIHRDCYEYPFQRPQKQLRYVSATLWTICRNGKQVEQNRSAPRSPWTNLW